MKVFGPGGCVAQSYSDELSDLCMLGENFVAARLNHVGVPMIPKVWENVEDCSLNKLALRQNKTLADLLEGRRHTDIGFDYCVESLVQNCLDHQQLPMTSICGGSFGLQKLRDERWPRSAHPEGAKAVCRNAADLPVAVSKLFGDQSFYNIPMVGRRPSPAKDIHGREEGIILSHLQ